MFPPNVRLILHPSLPWLLVLIAAAALPVAAQDVSASPSVKVEIAVEDVDPSMRNAFVPPAAKQLALAEPVAESAPTEPAPPAAQDIQETSASAPAPDTATQKTEMSARNLALGQELFAESTYLTKPGPKGSALNAFRKALAADPTNTAAKDGIQAIVNRLVAKAGEAHAEGKKSRARELLNSADGIVDSFVDRSAIDAMKASLTGEDVVVAKNDTEPAESEEAPTEEAAPDTPENTKAPSEAAVAEAANENDSEETKEVTPAVDVAEAPAASEAPSEGADDAAAAETPVEDAPATPEPEPAVEVADAPVAQEQPVETGEAETVELAAAEVQSLQLPAVYHVGRRLQIAAPEGLDGAVRWMVNENTVSEGGGVSDLDYAFREDDLGACEIRLYTLGKDGDPVLRAAGAVEVKLFADNPVDRTLGETLVLDPTRHGPVEGAYASYAWRVDGEAVSSEPTLHWNFDRPGTHRIECRMDGPQTDADQQWPSPVLAWEFAVEAPAVTAVAAAVPEPPARDPTVAISEPSPDDSKRQSDPLLVILGAAVIVLALSQAWMAYRLNALTRSAGNAKPEAPKPSAPTSAVLGSLPPEEDYMEELHQRFRSHETAQE